MCGSSAAADACPAVSPCRQRGTGVTRWQVRRLECGRSFIGPETELSPTRIARFIGVALVTSAALLASPMSSPSASAAPCPDVQVVFARGTNEPAGVGRIGQAFVDALSSRVGGRSLDVYAVNYPASFDFQRAADGVVDAGDHLRTMAADCPNTKMVLGGYSQGAAVIGYVTADAIPAGYTPPDGITGPLPPQVADHVAAVALFGKPSTVFTDRFHIDAPPVTIGPLYAAKTIDLCVPSDPICDDQAPLVPGPHRLYASNGMVTDAANFAARHLDPQWQQT